MPYLAPESIISGHLEKVYVDEDEENVDTQESKEDEIAIKDVGDEQNSDNQELNNEAAICIEHRFWRRQQRRREDDAKK